MQLQIKHIGVSQDNKPLFVVVYDGKQSPPVVLISPVEVSVGKHNTNLQHALRWYLENYIELPLEIYHSRAENTQTALSKWGKNCFNKLFGSKHAQNWYSEAQQENFDNLQLTIVSKDPDILSWPWEALKDKKGEFIAQHYNIKRQLPDINNISQLVQRAFDRLNILYIIARPTNPQYVGYQTIARPLTNFINKTGWPVYVDVLRPPTFEKLRQILEEKPNFYHVIHFDGHGKYSVKSGSELAFEKDDFDPSERCISAIKMGNLLGKHNVPLVVLNACQSAMITKEAKDPFASVATNLLQAGIPSVVAMSYSLWVSGARVFVPAFYQQLFKEGDVARAMLAGRKEMYHNKKRDIVSGQIDLQDWIVPVLYQQSVEASILPKLNSNKRWQSKLPNELKILEKYGFIGREKDILQLERVIREKPAGILIHGMAGEGKTTLIKGFLQWLKATNGIYKKIFWFNFKDIRNAEYILNTLSDSLLSTQERVLSIEEKLFRVTQVLKSKPFFIVWDNFESASGIPNTEVSALLSKYDCELIKQFLYNLSEGKTKVIIASRSPENWLTSKECQRLQLSGLKGQELWQYCNAVVKDLDLSFDRKSETYIKLMDKLGGNPLAIRAILLRLKEKSALEILTELENDFNGLEGDDATRRIQAALSVFEKGLKSDFAPVLRLLGLHEHCINIIPLRDVLKTTGNANTLIDACFATLENAGLCHNIGNNRYQIHPALRSCLIKTHPASEVDTRVFVNMMNNMAIDCIAQEIPEQWSIFTLFGANFYYALSIAQEIDAPEVVLTLTDTLAHYALNIRNFIEAEKLYTKCFEAAKKYNNKQAEASAYHNLGLIAQTHRNLTAAMEWYNKALEINQKLDDTHVTTQICHNLGNVAYEQRDFTAAEDWYVKALQINNQLGDKHAVAQIYHNLGMVAQACKNFNGATECYNEAKNIYQDLGDKHGEAQSCHQLGWVAQEQRNFVTAENSYVESLQINLNLDDKRDLGDKRGEAQTYHHLGMIAQEQRNFSEAEEWYNKSLQIDRLLGDKRSEAITYHQLGRIAFEQRNFTTAKKWYAKSLKIKRDLGDKHGVAQTYHQLGNVEFEQRYFGKAKKWYTKSIEINLKLGDKHTAAITYHQLGWVAQEQRDFITAKKHYDESLQIKRDLGDKRGEAQTYHHLGMIAQEQRNFSEAEEWYNKSFAISRDLGDKHMVAITYHQLGCVAFDQQNFTKAEDCHNKSLKIKQSLSDKYGEAQTYYELGLIAGERQDFTKAEDYYNKSLKINLKLDDKHTVAMIYYQLGWVTQEQRNFIDSKKWYHKALQIFIQLGDQDNANAVKQSLTELKENS